MEFVSRLFHNIITEQDRSQWKSRKIYSLQAADITISGIVTVVCNLFYRD